LNLQLQVDPEHRFGVEMLDDWSFETAHVKLAGWMMPFGNVFTAPTWQRVLVLLIGAVLSPVRRTVAAALRCENALNVDPRCLVPAFRGAD